MLIGAVHLLPLPGSPRWRGSMKAVAAAAARDARVYAGAGFDAVLFENFGDAPFVNAVQAPTVAAMSAVVAQASRGLRVELGVNVLRNDAEAALSVAEATGASFVRANVYAYAAVCDSGLVEACAPRLQRLKRLLGSAVKVYADVHVKHSRPLAPSIEDEARDAAGRGLADALVVTGPATGAPVAVEDLDRVRAQVRCPVLAGSGATTDAVGELLRHADGVIVASSLLRRGRVDRALASAFVRASRGPSGAGRRR